MPGSSLPLTNWTTWVTNPADVGHVVVGPAPSPASSCRHKVFEGDQSVGGPADLDVGPAQQLPQLPPGDLTTVGARFGIREWSERREQAHRRSSHCGDHRSGRRIARHRSDHQHVTSSPGTTTGSDVESNLDAEGQVDDHTHSSRIRYQASRGGMDQREQREKRRPSPSSCISRRSSRLRPASATTQQPGRATGRLRRSRMGRRLSSSDSGSRSPPVPAARHDLGQLPRGIVPGGTCVMVFFSTSSVRLPP